MNASARNTVSGCARCTSAISHSQNAIGLVCGLSTRNTVTPRSTQCRTTSRSASQSARQSSRVEVDVVDVLVALGRVLGVLERAVRAAVEPVGVLAQPGVVGRALDREVERDRDAELGRAGGQAGELPLVSELGVQRGVPAGLAADRPRAAGIRAARGRRVVAALAVRLADRVHGGQVEHVEAELGELRQHLLDAREAAPRAREELVPGAERRALGVDGDLERLVGDASAPSGRRPRRRGLPRRVSDATPSSAAPSESSLARSLCPAATLRSSSRCHDATRSTQATTPNCQRPSLSAANDPCQRSRSSGICRHRRLAPAARAPAAGSAARRRAPRARRARASPTRRRARRAARLTG